MAFAMRINFVDVICDGSLRNTYSQGAPDGFEFDIRLSCYRGHFLSVIDRFAVYIDGEEQPAENITFGINNKIFYVSQLQACSSEFWQLLEPARIRVFRLGGLAPGRHTVKVDLMCRVPYLPLPGAEDETSYMPLDAGGSKVMLVGGGSSDG